MLDKKTFCTSSICTALTIVTLFQLVCLPISLRQPADHHCSATSTPPCAYIQYNRSSQGSFKLYKSVDAWKNLASGVIQNPSQWTCVTNNDDMLIYHYRVGPFRVTKENEILTGTAILPKFRDLFKENNVFMESIFVGAVDANTGQPLSYPPMYVHHAGIVRSEGASMQQIFMIEGDRVVWGPQCSSFCLEAGYGYYIDDLSGPPLTVLYDLHSRLNGALDFYAQLVLRTRATNSRVLAPISRVSLSMVDSSHLFGYLHVEKWRYVVAWAQYTWPAHLGDGEVLHVEGHMHAALDKFYLVDARAHQVSEWLGRHYHNDSRSIFGYEEGLINSQKLETEEHAFNTAAHEKVLCVITSQKEVIGNTFYTRMHDPVCSPWRMKIGDDVTGVYFGRYPNVIGAHVDEVGLATSSLLPFHDTLLLFFASDQRKTCFTESQMDMERKQNVWLGRCYGSDTDSRNGGDQRDRHWVGRLPSSKDLILP